MSGYQYRGTAGLGQLNAQAMLLRDQPRPARAVNAIPSYRHRKAARIEQVPASCSCHWQWLTSNDWVPRRLRIPGRYARWVRVTRDPDCPWHTEVTL